MVSLKLPSPILRRLGTPVTPLGNEGRRGSGKPSAFEEDVPPSSFVSRRDLVPSSSPCSAMTRASTQGSAVSLEGSTVRRKHMFMSHDITRSYESQEEQRLEDVYNVDDRVLGRGGYGTVRLARLKGAPTVVRAVKTVLKRNLKAISFVRREISILRRLDHPCICRLFETFEDDRAIYLVLEFIEGRELFDEIVDGGCIDEFQSALVMRQVFSALQYCHERNTIHRDLKPDNIMIQRVLEPTETDSEQNGGTPDVKLIDFGLAIISSRTCRAKQGSSLVGTVDYLAPETRKGTCVPASDMWSVGMVLHALLVGELPFGDCLGSEEVNLSGSQYDNVSAEAKDLLRGLLREDPSNRLTAVAAALHPWTRRAWEASTPQGLSPSIIGLSSFHRSVKLRRAALTAVAMQVTGKQMSGFRDLFLAIDTDGNGRISKDELATSIALAAPGGGTEDVRAWVEDIFDSIDTDGSQEIEYTEWLAAALHEGAYRSEEALRAAFRVFDSDGDGGIDQRELGRVLSQTPEEIAGLMPEFDTNGDGSIDFEEFKAIFESWNPPPAEVKIGTSIISL